MAKNLILGEQTNLPLIGELYVFKKKGKREKKQDADYSLKLE